MKPQAHHITIRGEAWCNWSGCKAGQDIMIKAGGVTCGHRSKAAALKGAQALRPHFTAGSVQVVAGSCTNS